MDSGHQRSWPVCDIAYVRDQYADCTARVIAGDLKVPVRRVQKLVQRLELHKRNVVGDEQQSNNSKTMAMNDLDRPASRANGAVSTCASPSGSDRSYGPDSMPADLLEFVRAQSVRDAANALRLSLGTVHRLVKGYWPADPRKILQAWTAHKGRAGRIASSWFLRRVRTGGMVSHAGQQWSAPGLATRTGQLLAVARADDGALLAQTLDLPAERLQLAQVPSGEVS